MRNYAVAIILDISDSMRGPTREPFMLATTIMLLTALHEANGERNAVPNPVPPRPTSPRPTPPHLTPPHSALPRPARPAPPQLTLLPTRSLERLRARVR